MAELKQDFRDRFVQAWNNANSIDEIRKRFCYASNRCASSFSAKLRRMGYELKKMKKCRWRHKIIPGETKEDRKRRFNREYSRKWRDSNRAKVRERNREYAKRKRLLNAEKLKQQAKIYRARHHKETLERHRKWRAKNREYVRACHRKIVKRLRAINEEAWLAKNRQRDRKRRQRSAILKLQSELLVLRHHLKGLPK